MKAAKRIYIGLVFVFLYAPIFILMLYSFNDSRSRGKWGGFASKILKTGEKRAVKYADEIIVLSKNVQKYFKETYNRDTTYIPNGVNPPVKKEVNVIREKYGLEKEDYILFLARVVPEKGCHYLIEAYNNLTKEERKGKKLVIAGGSSHSDEYYSSRHHA